MKRPLVLLFALASCAPASAPPPHPVPAPGSSSQVRPAAGLREIAYIVDGVQHTEESLRRLNLQPDDIESVQVHKCTDYCDRRSTVDIRWKPVRQ